MRNPELAHILVIKCDTCRVIMGVGLYVVLVP